MRARLEAFLHAFRGARTLVATQPHAKFHLAASAVVLGFGAICHLSLTEWALVVIAIAIVWLAEALNTSIEFLSDEVTLERRERIKYAKDIAAFAVLIASVAALVIAVIVFGPKVLALGR